MMKASGIFSSFSTPSLFDLTGSILIDDNDRAQLTDLDKVLIRANDFTPVMPVIEYPPASGNYVANPNNGVNYQYNLPDPVFGNYHSLMMEGLVVDTFARPKDQIISIHPRSASYFQEHLTQSPNYHSFDMIDGGGKAWLDEAETTNKKIYKVNEWFKWQIDCVGKYFMEIKITGSNVGVGDLNMAYLVYRGQYDGFLADDISPKGLFRTSNTQYTQGNSYFRSPGKEYEDMINPAVLQLWPYLNGFAMYKNSANKYIKFNADMVAAVSTGTFELNMLNMPQNTSRYLCTVRITSYLDLNPFWVLQVVEGGYNLGDFITYGGYCDFPDDPTFKPFRIVAVNVASENQIWTFENISQDMFDKIDAGSVRCNIYINTIVPLFVGYPIPESPIILPQTLSGDMFDIRGFQANPPDVGDKFTFGIYLNNFDNTFNEDDKFCKELIYVLNPFPTDTPNAPVITGANDGTGTSFTVTIDGDTGVTNYLWYKKNSDVAWTNGGNRVGDGDIQVTGLDSGIYEALVISQNALLICSPPSNKVNIFVSDTDTSLHERIMDHIVSTLEAILISNGYKLDVAKVDRIKKPPKQLTQFPYLMVGMNNEPEDFENNKQKNLDLDVTILGWVRSADSSKPDDTSLLVAEIKRALVVDQTRGGLAWQTIVKDKRITMDTKTFPHQQSYSRIEIDVGVLFLEAKGNPYGIV